MVQVGPVSIDRLSSSSVHNASNERKDGSWNQLRAVMDTIEPVNDQVLGDYRSTVRSRTSFWTRVRVHPACVTVFPQELRA